MRTKIIDMFKKEIVLFETFYYFSGFLIDCSQLPLELMVNFDEPMIY
jgi:hypothetical protein